MHTLNDFRRAFYLDLTDTNRAAIMVAADFFVNEKSIEQIASERGLSQPEATELIKKGDRVMIGLKSFNFKLSDRKRAAKRAIDTKLELFEMFKSHLGMKQLREAAESVAER